MAAPILGAHEQGPRSQYVGGVLQFFPNKRFMTGVDYLFGQRRNRNRDTGSDNRVQVSTLVKF